MTPASTTAPDAATTTTTTSTPTKLEGRLLFSRFDESTHTFVSTHVAAADGSGEAQITMPGPEGGGRWSHAGGEIAVMTILDDGRVGTAIITAEGVVERILTIPDPTLNLVCVVWSPDDDRLACEGFDDSDPSRNGLYTVGAASGADLIRVTTTPDGMADLPGDFTPDGADLLFKRGADEANGTLFLAAAAALADPRPFGSGEFEDPGRFSPDGTLIATSINGRLVILGADGTVHDTIDVHGHYLFGPSWSPTGDWIAYSSAPGGVDADIFISHPDGSGTRQITNTPDNEIVVEWGSA